MSRVEQQVGVVSGHAPDPREVADPGVGEDQTRLRELAGQLHGVEPQGRDPASGVDQHRKRALVGEGAELAHPGMIERELLGPGVQLDPLRARVQGALGLGTGASFGVQPAERRQQPVRLPGGAITMSLAGG